ncbi:MAG: amidohydrolase [Thermodesulfobacteriota bacterium]
MDYLLRTYAHVRNQVRTLKRNSSKNKKNDFTPPPAYTASLQSSLPDIDTSGAADILIKNARVFPPDDEDRGLTAISIKSGRITSVHPGAEDMQGKNTTVVDAAGGSVIPGFRDCHLHLMAGLEQTEGCDTGDIENTKDLKARLKPFISERPHEPAYYAYGLHYTDIPIIPPQQARHVLDEIEAEKPVFIYAHDLHTGWANTKALKIAGLMHRMPPYPELLRELKLENNLILDRDQLPSGELREPPVYFLVDEALRRHAPLSVEQKKSRLEKTCRDLAALGLTSVHNMGLDLPEEDIECLLLLLELEEEDRLPLRVHSSCSVVADENMFEDVMRAARVRDNLEMARSGSIDSSVLRERLLKEMQEALDSRKEEKTLPISGGKLRDRFTQLFTNVITPEHMQQHNRRIRKIKDRTPKKELSQPGKVQCKAVKLFMDGVVEKDTAFRLDHHPVQGIPAFAGEDLDRVVCLADHLGLQVAAHCIGNGAVNAMLNSIEEARRENSETDQKRGEKIRHRIEHIELCNSFDIPRFSHLEVIASMQALHEREPVTLWHEKVPEIEWATAFAWKSLMDAGAILVFGSDWPIVSCNCLKGIERATGRKPWKADMPDQHLDLTQAVAAFSTSGTMPEYAENIRGQIKKGMQADLTVLSENLLEYAGKYDRINVLWTISDGQIQYARKEARNPA